MLAERVEQLRAEYVDQYVVIDEERPELTRFKDTVGQVKAISFNGRALVEFDAHDDRGRHDIGLDYLKVVDKPEPPSEPQWQWVVHWFRAVVIRSEAKYRQDTTSSEPNLSTGSA